MNKTQIRKRYIRGLYLNIGVSTICILTILGLAYHKSSYIPLANNTTSNNTKSSITTTDYENITADIPNQVDDINAFVAVIRQQSKEQLRAWQIKNSDSTFVPENIIPMYFKEFYGDKTSMTR